MHSYLVALLPGLLLVGADPALMIHTQGLSPHYPIVTSAEEASHALLSYVNSLPPTLAKKDGIRCPLIMDPRLDALCKLLQKRERGEESGLLSDMPLLAKVSEATETCVTNAFGTGPTAKMLEVVTRCEGDVYAEEDRALSAACEHLRGKGDAKALSNFEQLAAIVKETRPLGELTQAVMVVGFLVAIVAVAYLVYRFVFGAKYYNEARTAAVL